jgi:hypothetical protein
VPVAAPDLAPESKPAGRSALAQPERPTRWSSPRAGDRRCCVRPRGAHGSRWIHRDDGRRHRSVASRQCRGVIPECRRDDSCPARSAAQPGICRCMGSHRSRQPVPGCARPAEFVTSAFDQETPNPDWVKVVHGPTWRETHKALLDQFGVLPNAGARSASRRRRSRPSVGFRRSFRRVYRECRTSRCHGVQLAGIPLHYAPEAGDRVRYRTGLLDLFRQGLAGSSCAPLLYERYRAAGMGRRTIDRKLRSWARLLIDFSKARPRADLAPLMVRLGRELGRLTGSGRHRVFYP